MLFIIINLAQICHCFHHTNQNLGTILFNKNHKNTKIW
ncbi:hypothetical protein AO382_0359 [Moraxella catarrhalis]|uniref:Uncharacterized protein n=1 Tax=Moraxella catarrhalis TaxID=480 RepID=A0A7Z0V043_MORCA|nr:hypothetical protein AO382_0359 [Moraxella catarrhalis]